MLDASSAAGANANGIGIADSFSWSSNYDLLLKVGDDTLSHTGQIYFAAGVSLGNTTGLGNLYLYVAAQNSPFTSAFKLLDNNASIQGNANKNHVTLSLPSNYSLSSSTTAWTSSPGTNALTLTNIASYVVRQTTSTPNFGSIPSHYDGFHITQDISLSSNTNLGSLPAGAALIGASFLGTAIHYTNYPGAFTVDLSNINTITFTHASHGLFATSNNGDNLVAYLGVELLHNVTAAISSNVSTYGILADQYEGSSGHPSRINNISIDGSSGTYTITSNARDSYIGGLFGLSNYLTATGEVDVSNVAINSTSATSSSIGDYGGAIGKIASGSNSFVTLNVTNPSVTTNNGSGGTINLGGAIGVSNANTSISNLSLTGFSYSLTGTSPTLYLGSVIGQYTAGTNTLGAVNIDTVTSGHLWSAGTIATPTIGSLTVTGATSLSQNVTTTGNQTYEGTVTLGTNVTLDADGAAISLADVDGSSSYYTLTIGSTAVARSTVSFGTVGAGFVYNALGALTITNNIPTTLNGSVSTTGVQSYEGCVTLGEDTTLTTTSSPITFSSTLDGNHALVLVTGTGVVTFTGVVGGGTNLTSLDSTPSNTVAINNNIITTGSQSYVGITLGGDATLKTTNSNIGFSGTISGAHALTLNTGSGGSAGSVTFGGNVGYTPLTALTSLNTGSGAVSLTGNVTTTGADGQNYGGTITLNSGSVLTAGTGLIIMSNVSGESSNLHIASASAVTFGTITNVHTLQIDSTIPATLTGDVTTTTAQTYPGTVTLGGTPSGTIILTNSSGDISFYSTVDATPDGEGGSQGQALTLAATGNVNFDGNMGLIYALGSLNTGASAVNMGPAGGATPTSIATTGAQTYGGTMTLSDDMALTAGGTIELGAVTGQNYSLNIAGNAVDLNDNISGVNNLSINDGLPDNTITLSNSISGITTSGYQTYGSPMTLGTNLTLEGSTITLKAITGAGNNLTITGNSVLDGAFSVVGNFSVSGTTALNNSITTLGTQIYTGAMTLGADSTLTTTDHNITFGGAIDGAHALTLSTGVGALSFGGSAGTTTPLISLDTGLGPISMGRLSPISITTTGDQTYRNTLTLNDDLTLSSTEGGTVVLQTVAGNGHNFTLTGNMTLNNPINNINNLSVNNGSDYSANTITLNEDITTTGNQIYGGTVTLGNTRTLTAGNSSTLTLGNVDGTISAYSLTINGSTSGVTLGNIGFSNPLTTLLINDTNAITLNGGITTVDSQTYSGTVTLNTDSTLESTTGNVTLNTSIAGGGNSLTLSATEGLVTMNDTVDNIDNLRIDGPSKLNVSITTTGTQVYTGLATLGGNTTLNGTFITLADISGVTSGTHYGLTIASSTGSVGFGNVGGGGNYLTHLTITNPITIVLGGNVSTSANQLYGGAVTLGTNTSLNSSSNPINFQSAINGNYDLILSTGTGSITFGGNVGSGTSLASVNTGIGPVNLYGNVTTTGTQTYSGSITLGADNLTLTGGTISLGPLIATGTGTPYNLTITGNSALNGLFTNINNFSVSGTTALNSSITTSGTQTYSGNVTLDSDFTLTSETNYIEFDGSVDGAHNLIIATPTTQVTFGSANLASLTIGSGVSTILTSNVTTTGDQTYGGAITLAADPTLRGDTITIGSTIDGAQDLFVYANTINLNADIGDTTPITSLTVGPNGAANRALTVNGTSSIATTGNQSYTASMTLDNDLALKATNGSIEFSADSTITGSYALTIQGTTGGGIVTQANLPVLNTVPYLTTLSVTASAIDLIGDATTTGPQTYYGPVNLAATPITLTTTGISGLISFTSTLNGASVLTTNSGSQGVYFGGVVGGIIPLISMDISGVGTITIRDNVTTQLLQSYTMPVNLGNNLALTVTTSPATKDDGILFINSTITGNALGGPFNLTIDVPSGRGGVKLATVTGVNTLVLGNSTTPNIAFTGNITTTGNQTYHGPVTVGADSTLTTNTDIIFSSSINGFETSYNLTLSAANISLPNNIGTTHSLSNLTATALNGGSLGNITLGNITTITEGLQIYTGAVILNGDVTLQTVTGQIGFQTFTNGFGRQAPSTIDGAHSLTIQGAPDGGVVETLQLPLIGSGTPLTSLNSIATLINLTDNITTTESQTYTGTTNLSGTDATLTSTANNISIGAITSTPTAQNLTLNAAGTLSMGQIGVWTGAPLTSLTTTAPAITLSGSAYTVNNQIYNGTVTMVGIPTLYTNQWPIYTVEPGTWIVFNPAPGPVAETYIIYRGPPTPPQPEPPLPPNPTNNNGGNGDLPTDPGLGSNQDSGQGGNGDGNYTAPDGSYTIEIAPGDVPTDPADPGTVDTTFTPDDITGQLLGGSPDLGGDENQGGSDGFTNDSGNPIDQSQQPVDPTDSGTQDTSFSLSVNGSQVVSSLDAAEDDSSNFQNLEWIPIGPVKLAPALQKALEDHDVGNQTYDPDYKRKTHALEKKLRTLRQENIRGSDENDNRILANKISDMEYQGPAFNMDHRFLSVKTDNLPAELQKDIERIKKEELIAKNLLSQVNDLKLQENRRD
ncbi:MAG: hypothetical protein WCG05_01675 [Alphaproteobacteria bacterium]